MPRSDADRLADIAASCRRIAGFIAGMQYEGFKTDERTVRAVLYELVVIGEAAKGLSDAARSRHATIPWKQVAGMRDVVVHQYHGVMIDVVWETVRNRVPLLLRELQG